MSAPVRIIWVASYPKSGNTWVRFLLLNLLLGKQTCSEHLDRFIPDIHKCPGWVHFQPGVPALAKIHFLFSPSMPLYAQTAGFIYVVRNPLDIMLSAVNYAFLKKGVANNLAERKLVRESYIRDFISHGGDPKWIEGRLGSWDQHVRSWVLDNPGIPHLVLRYEDMIVDPLAQLTRVNDFLALGADRERMRMAVENSSFERIKMMEEQELSQGKKGFFFGESSLDSIKAGNRFMSRGRPGAGESELTEAERERLLARFGPTMELMGYKPRQCLHNQHDV